MPDMSVVSRVGSKGELFIPKEIREKLRLKPGMRVIFKVRDGILVVEPIPNIEDVLKEPTYVRIEIDEFHKFRKEISRRVES
ncbi:MAG: AbrB/MazE/SpoVT family DNA-binding domain-containing protein [Sulfolobales archaeon]